MAQEFVSNSFFLCDQPAIDSFADAIAGRHADRPRSFAVVCERKEDLKAIRAQLYNALNKRDPARFGDVVGGISMFTLDNVAQTFISSLANSDRDQLGSVFYDYFQNPYMDVVTQEKFVEYVLLKFGYVGNDSLPIAKQILTLLDVEWPRDFNFLDLIRETQSLDNTRTVHEITEASLKRIIATYQYAGEVLKSHARFQRFVLDYAQTELVPHINRLREESQSKIYFPTRLLNCNLLWVAAPEYAMQRNTHAFYRPGNFQASLVDILRDTLSRAVERFSNADCFWHARVVVDENKLAEALTISQKITYQIFEDRHAFFTRIENAIEDPDDSSTLFLLADFDPGSTREINSDAAGGYPITDSELEVWQTYRSHLDTSDENNLNAFLQIAKQVESFWSAHLSLESLTQNKMELLTSLCQQYALESPKSGEVLFNNHVQNEKVSLGKSSCINSLDRALSYIPIETMPETLCAVGRPHAPTSPSFNVKILNDCFSILRRRGVPIEVLASDVTYRGYWLWVCSLSMPLNFLLTRTAELDEFPDALRPRGDAAIEIAAALPSCTNRTSLVTEINSHADNLPWWKKYDWPLAAESRPLIAATHFEDFVNCPLTFFLKHVAKINPAQRDFAKGDPLHAGILTHKICEVVVSRLNLAFPEGRPDSLPFIKKIVTLLRNEDLFISSNIDLWLTTFESATESLSLPQNSKAVLKALVSEICKTIFSLDDTVLENKVTREIVKRSFLRFLESEVRIIEAYPERRVGFVEHPISVDLGNLQISGRIDRVDFDATGLHIYDYKNSKISKTNRSLSVLPSSNQKVSEQLSVQAGLYAYALARRTIDEGSLPVKSAALYKLKSLNLDLDPVLQQRFEPPLNAHTELFTTLATTLTHYANELYAGRFAPKPLLKTSCTNCAFQSICPLHAVPEESEE